MKKLLAFLLCFLWLSSSFAQSLFDQLYAYNFNWEKHKSQLPEGDAYTISNEVEMVQLHLSFVLPILKENSLKYRPQEREKRALLIAHLEEYKNEGCFPINYQRIGRVPVFIDQHQTHCAVAYLLKQTGKEDLAKGISKEYNLAWLKDMQSQELVDWQKSSGFSLEELKLIQGAYDNYHLFGRTRPDRFEIPQEPQVGTEFLLARERVGLKSLIKPGLWLYGEGENGVLNGKWLQHSANGKLWIEGFFSNGKRSGQWKEYYKGTDILCRTENWRDHKLNGLRKRFNREGELIEIIDFKNGKAISKINNDLEKGLQYIRIPNSDNSSMKTKVFSLNGTLLAFGNEEVHNPGNLQWFQDIELTALNYFALENQWGRGSFSIAGNSNLTAGSQLGIPSPSLVEFKKFGTWTFYRERWTGLKTIDSSNLVLATYPHFGDEIISSFKEINEKISNCLLDSVEMKFNDNKPLEFIAEAGETFHLFIKYHPKEIVHTLNLNYYNSRRHRPNVIPKEINTIAEKGEFDENGEKKGVWRYYNKKGEMYRMEDYRVEI